jgi:hypothetical protein
MNPDNLSAGDWFFGRVIRMGANWQTTLSGIGGAIFECLTLLSGASYALGDVALVIPAPVKAKIFGASLTAQIILKIWNAFVQKSKNVTGGNTQQTMTGDLTKPGDQTLVDVTKASSPESNNKPKTI